MLLYMKIIANTIALTMARHLSKGFTDDRTLTFSLHMTRELRYREINLCKVLNNGEPRFKPA